MKNLLIVLMTMLTACTSQEDIATSAVTDSVPPNLAPLAWNIGTWRCAGHYETVPPFTKAHDDKATFVIRQATGGVWLDGQYVEQSVTSGFTPIAISEHYTLAPTSPTNPALAGRRHFEDSNLGGFDGTFLVNSSDGGAVHVEFTGTYSVLGTSVPFTESVDRPIPIGTVDSFTTESRVILPVGVNGMLEPVVFHRQKCILGS